VQRSAVFAVGFFVRLVRSQDPLAGSVSARGIRVSNQEVMTMLTLWNQFDDLFGDDLFRGRRQVQKANWPAVDIEESQGGYVLTADVPGLAADQIEINVEDGVLTFKGERKTERKEEKDGYRRYERTFGAFRRSFVLPKGVDPAAVEAQVRDGQLTVRVPKPAQAQPRRVAIKANGGEELESGESRNRPLD
jgi:HSP20 family protein